MGLSLFWHRSKYCYYQNKLVFSSIDYLGVIHPPPSREMKKQVAGEEDKKNKKKKHSQKAADKTRALQVKVGLIRWLYCPYCALSACTQLLVMDI